MPLPCCKRGGELFDWHVVLLNLPSIFHGRDIAAGLQAKHLSSTVQYLPNDSTMRPILSFTHPADKNDTLLRSLSHYSSLAGSPVLYEANDAWGGEIHEAAHILKGTNMTSVLGYAPLDVVISTALRQEGSQESKVSNALRAAFEFGLMMDGVNYPHNKHLMTMSKKQLQSALQSIPCKSDDEKVQHRYISDFLGNALNLRGNDSVHIIPRHEIYDTHVNLAMPSRSNADHIAKFVSTSRAAARTSELTNAVVNRGYDPSLSPFPACESCKEAMANRGELLHSPNARHNSSLPFCYQCLKVASEGLHGTSMLAPGLANVEDELSSKIEEDDMKLVGTDMKEVCWDDQMKTPNTGNTNSYYYLHWHSVKHIELEVKGSLAVSIKLGDETGGTKGLVIRIEQSRLLVNNNGHNLTPAAFTTPVLFREKYSRILIAWSNGKLRVATPEVELLNVKLEVNDPQFLGLQSDDNALWKLYNGQRGFGPVGSTVAPQQDSIECSSSPLSTLAGPSYTNWVSLKRCVFEVKAAHSAAIVLSPSQSSSIRSKAAYEIIIGGWGNTKSVLRRTVGGNNEAVATTNFILSAAEYKKFWVTWEKNAAGHAEVCFGIGDTRQPILKFIDQSPLDINFIAVSTFSGARGKWKFPLRYTPIPLPRERFGVVDYQKLEGQPRVAFQYYEGSFQYLPDFGILEPTTSGSLPYLISEPMNQSAKEYAYRYSFFILAHARALHSFRVTCQDGAALIINGQRVVECDGVHNPTASFGQVIIKEGWNPVDLLYFKSQYGTPKLEVEWFGKETQNEWKPLSADNLRPNNHPQPVCTGHPKGGVFYELYRDIPGSNLPDGILPVSFGCIPTIKAKAFDKGPPDHFGIRYTFEIVIVKKGVYKFHLLANDRGILSIDGKGVMESNGQPKTTEVSLDSGSHPCSIDYICVESRPLLKLSYSPIGYNGDLPIHPKLVINVGHVLYELFNPKSPGIPKSFDGLKVTKAGLLDTVEILNEVPTLKGVVRLRSKLDIKEGGTYTFKMVSKGASRVFVDGAPLSQCDKGSVSQSVKLERGRHNLLVDVVLGEGPIQFLYSGIDTNNREVNIPHTSLICPDKSILPVNVPSGTPGVLVQHLNRRQFLKDKPDPPKLVSSVKTPAGCRTVTQSKGTTYTDFRPTVPKYKKLRIWFKGAAWMQIALSLTKPVNTSLEEYSKWESDPQNIEVVIAGDGQWSSIRKGLSSRGPTGKGEVTVPTPGIVSIHEYRLFWVKWTKGKLRVGREGNTTPFITMNLPAAEFNYYAFATGHNSPGDFVVQNCSDCTVAPWGAWSECTKECGGGSQVRSRDITTSSVYGLECPKLVEERKCNTDVPCNKDCKTTAWSAWSTPGTECSGKADVHHTKNVITPQKGNGKACEVVVEKKRVKAGDDETGVLSQWSDWSACSHQEGGDQYRFRAVTKSPKGEGKLPFGPSVEHQHCGAQINQNCRLSDWSAWSECTKSCGGGKQHRYRTVLEQPLGKGTPCGSLHEARDCNASSCNKQCKVSEWSDWSACSKVCGGGYRTRTRTILESPTGPNQCPPLVESKPCNDMKCCPEIEEPAGGPQDCKYTEWGQWGQCSKACGGGERYRYRAIATSATKNGKKCGTEADLVQVEKCNPNPCDVDCVVSPWTKWTECTEVCGGKGVSVRDRTVVVQQQGQGKACPLLHEEQKCNEKPCDKDCTLSPWSKWSECSAACGGGETTRTRTILKPARGKGVCVTEKELIERKPCNTQACNQDCKVGKWGEWSKCSKECDGGSQWRERPVLVDQKGKGQACPDRIEVRKCNSQPCNAECEVSPWGEWSKCTAQENGQQMRTRKVTKPAKGDKSCPALVEVRKCSLPSTSHLQKEDCVPTEWSAWSPCSKPCGGGTQERTRTVEEPAMNGGAPCGPLVQRRSCNDIPCPAGSPHPPSPPVCTDHIVPVHACDAGHVIDVVCHKTDQGIVCDRK